MLNSAFKHDEFCIQNDKCFPRWSWSEPTILATSATKCVQMMNFESKTRNFVSKTMNFAGGPRCGRGAAAGRWAPDTPPKHKDPAHGYIPQGCWARHAVSERGRGAQCAHSEVSRRREDLLPGHRRVSDWLQARNLRCIFYTKNDEDFPIKNDDFMLRKWEFNDEKWRSCRTPFTSRLLATGSGLGRWTTRWRGSRGDARGVRQVWNDLVGPWTSRGRGSDISGAFSHTKWRFSD